LNDLQVTYKLVKKIMGLREDLVNWGRLSRESKLNDIHEKGMMKHAYEIDELLRDIGVEWINDYEANLKIKATIK
jgi:hypothetical protein